MDLDYLCRLYSSFHSWGNPVERIMSLLNLGLQCVGLAQEQMSDKYETEVAKCNSMADLRKMAMKETNFVDTTLDSSSGVKITLFTIFLFKVERKDGPTANFSNT